MLKLAVSVMYLALTLALTLASTLALTLVISSGGGIMLMSTASCAHACCECDLYSFDSSFISSPDFSFDSSYLFRWWHHAHVDC